MTAVRARAAGTRRRNSGSGGEGPKKRRHVFEPELLPKEKSFNRYAFMQAYLLMAVTGIGYLAFVWSTVVLLGGFVTALGKKDFWCITAISTIQAARVFSDWEEGVILNFIREVSAVVMDALLNVMILLINPSQITKGKAALILFFPIIYALSWAFICLEIIFLFGAYICAGISLWRITKHDYGDIQGDRTKANLIPALDIFYSLVIIQGALFFLWFTSTIFVQSYIVGSFNGVCQFPKSWGRYSVVRYLQDTRSKYWKDPKSMEDRRLIKFAVDWLDSESPKDCLAGKLMLDKFIKQGKDVRSLLLPSRPKIQKLIDTLRWRSGDRQGRELAARILAHLACDMDLSQFPGAMRCISSLLDTTLPYWSNHQEANNQSSPGSKLEKPADKERLISGVNKLEQHGEEKIGDQDGDDQQGEEGDSSIKDSQGNDWNELILQGLTILERLASDQHNCRDICSTPGLLPKIMAPLYSQMLVQHINVGAWADVVNGSLKVVHRLIRAPGRTGRRLRREIASSKQALTNLEGILDQGNNCGPELQMRAIDILAELTFDPHTNLSKETKENIIEKQLQIFLTDDQVEEESATKFIELKVAAGQALVLLSGTELLSQTGSISVLIKSKYSYIVLRLTEILDAKDKITYRTTAAKILENLCTHHTMDTIHMKNTLLPKALTEVLSSKGGPQSKISKLGNDAGNRGRSAQGTDEENQIQGSDSQFKSSSQENEEHAATMEFQEAFLSLALAICKKLTITAGDLDDVAQKIPHKDVEVAAKLKAIVEENCEATADCLRIVKLCGEISLLMMTRRSQYITPFRNQQFGQSLTKALKNMSNLESCILFAGTDCGAKKTAEPLLFDLEKEVLNLVG